MHLARHKCRPSKVCVTPKVREWCMKFPFPGNYYTFSVSKDMPGDRCAIQNHAGRLKMEETACSTTPFGPRLELNNANPPQGVFVLYVGPLSLEHCLRCPFPYGVNNEAGFGLQQLHFHFCRPFANYIGDQPLLYRLNQVNINITYYISGHLTSCSYYSFQVIGEHKLQSFMSSLTNDQILVFLFLSVHHYSISSLWVCGFTWVNFVRYQCLLVHNIDSYLQYFNVSV